MINNDTANTFLSNIKQFAEKHFFGIILLFSTDIACIFGSYKILIFLNTVESKAGVLFYAGVIFITILIIAFICLTFSLYAIIQKLIKEEEFARLNKTQSKTFEGINESYRQLNEHITKEYKELIFNIRTQDDSLIKNLRDNSSVVNNPPATMTNASSSDDLLTN